MISIEDLKKIAKLKGIKSTSNAEKDYLIDILLLSISKNTKDELVFKGGTCLFKFYKLDRFSDDIDFTLKKEMDISALLKKIISDLAYFKIEAEVKDEKRIFNSIMIKLSIKGPLYNGDALSLSNVRIDINTKSSIDLSPLVENYTPLYSEIPSFSLQLMQEREILAEKVRAVMTRTRARDLYDMWFLLKKGIDFDKSVIEKKLNYYNKKWDKTEFLRKISIEGSIWEKELKHLVSFVPDFKEVKKLVIEKLKARKY